MLKLSRYERELTLRALARMDQQPEINATESERAGKWEREQVQDAEVYAAKLRYARRFGVGLNNL